jgi:putative flippase GtrA
MHNAGKLSAATMNTQVLFQFLRYGFAGGCALATHLIVLWGLVELLAIDRVVASAAGFLAAIPVNYWLQYRFVFNASGDHSAVAARYLATTLAGLALNTALFAAANMLLQIPYIIAQTGVTLLVFAVNFVANRHFTFSARRSDKRSSAKPRDSSRAGTIGKS